MIQFISTASREVVLLHCVAMIQEILLKRNVSVYRAKAGGRLDSIAIGIERASETHLIEIGIASIDYIN